jgi:hypothetical protein
MQQHWQFTNSNNATNQEMIEIANFLKLEMKNLTSKGVQTRAVSLL